MTMTSKKATARRSTSAEGLSVREQQAAARRLVTQRRAPKSVAQGASKKTGTFDDDRPILSILADAERLIGVDAADSSEGYFPLPGAMYSGPARPFDKLLYEWEAARDAVRTASGSDLPDEEMSTVVSRWIDASNTLMAAPAETVADAAIKLECLLAAQDIKLEPSEAYAVKKLEWPHQFDERFVRCIVTTWADLVAIQEGRAQPRDDSSIIALEAEANKYRQACRDLPINTPDEICDPVADMEFKAERDLLALRASTARGVLAKLWLILSLIDDYPDGRLIAMLRGEPTVDLDFVYCCVISAIRDLAAMCGVDPVPHGILVDPHRAGAAPSTSDQRQRAVAITDAVDVIEILGRRSAALYHRHNEFDRAGTGDDESRLMELHAENQRFSTEFYALQDAIAALPATSLPAVVQQLVSAKGHLSHVAENDLPEHEKKAAHEAIGRCLLSALRVLFPMSGLNPDHDTPIRFFTTEDEQALLGVKTEE